MPEGDYAAGGAPPAVSARLVVLTGCSGGGKSALLAEMARRGYPVRPEPGRQIVREQLSIAGDALPWSDAARFVELCVARAMHFYNTARPGEHCVLFDRSIVDAVAALPRLGLPVPAHLSNALQRYRYAGVVFMTPPWEALFAADRERRHNFADAVAEYEALLEAYPANGYAVELLPKVGPGERADFLEGRLARLLAGPAVIAPARLARGRIRPAGPADQVAVQDCINAAFGGFTLRIGRPPAPMLADYDALLAAGRVHLLEADGAVQGALVSEPRADHWFVEVLAVRPEAQRQGVGRRLMTCAAQQAHRHGLGEIRLYTHELMQGALALYHALDYEETERRLEDGYARVYLRKVLLGDAKVAR
jgi:predicted ATPase/predicted N-acetyltransferase YhbS